MFHMVKLVVVEASRSSNRVVCNREIYLFLNLPRFTSGITAVAAAAVEAGVV